MRADAEGLQSLTSRERTVVLAWSALGIISNGGFKYYYEGAWMMAEVAAAFRTLGFEQVAAACESTLELFPGRIPPSDYERRSAILQNVDFDQFAEAEEEVFGVTWESLETAIGAYLHRRPHDFRS